MAIIAVTNRKGGVGKSTITANLAAALARSVIVFDCDPQQSLVAWAGLGEGILSRILQPLETTEAEQFEHIVKQAAARYQWVIIDTPPGFDTPALLAAQTADVVLIPTGPSPLEILATKQTLTIMDQARAERDDKGKPLVYLVPSRVTRTRIGKELDRTLKMLGVKTLPGISQRAAVTEATMAGLTVVEHAPLFSPAAAEFKKLSRALQRLIKTVK